jgi:hypothetical protein
MKPSQSVLVFKTFLVTFFVACTSFGQSSNRLIDLSKVKLTNKTSTIKSETRQGPGSGGGGNTCALMLKQNAIELIERVQAYPPFQSDNIAEILKANIQAAQFFPGDHLEIAGKDVEAINYPTKKIIVIEQSFCDKVITFSTASLGITLHEYLGLAGIADESYQISGPFVNSIYTAERNRRSAGPSFLDNQVNNLRAKFENSRSVTDYDVGTMNFNLSCTYFGEAEGKPVQKTFALHRSPDQGVFLKNAAQEAISLKAENSLGEIIVSLPSKKSENTTFLTLRQLAPEIFIAEWSILGNTLIDSINLRKGPYPVASSSIVASQAMGYSLCLPQDK